MQGIPSPKLLSTQDTHSTSRLISGSPCPWEQHPIRRIQHISFSVVHAAEGSSHARAGLTKEGRAAWLILALSPHPAHDGCPLLLLFSDSSRQQGSAIPCACVAQTQGHSQVFQEHFNFALCWVVRVGLWLCTSAGSRGQWETLSSLTASTVYAVAIWEPPSVA